MNEEIRALLEKTAAALERNNMKPYIAETKEEALEIVKTLVKEGDTVASGGSMTLKETGVSDLLASGSYNYLDRNGLSGDELKKCFRAAFSADVYFSSSNAITENGELYNVDGNANRIAAITFGPDSVVIVAGYNKIVPDLDSAVKRVKECAAPPNGTRLGLETYCAKEGRCINMTGCNGDFADGCKSAGRMCCSFLVTSHQRAKDRIKVILVGEKLGY
ncbi:MAG: lactate utilization protein [Oscillospiraceae bacterium]|nr:lactate utilization protein [Oscillospiraceae bacterium]